MKPSEIFEGEGEKSSLRKTFNEAVKNEMMMEESIATAELAGAEMKNIKEVEREFDIEHPVITIGHHHYRRERYLKRFIRQAIKDALESCVPNRKPEIENPCATDDMAVQRIIGYNSAIADMRENIKKFLV